MADATETGVVINTEASDDAKQESQVEAVAEKATDAESKRVAELEAELTKAREILEKARKGEKYHKQSKQELEQRVQELEAQGDWKAKYEQMVERENGRVLDTALSDALKDAVKPENVKAVLKLIDRSAINVKDGAADAKSIEAAVLKTKEEFPNLFVEVTTPAPKRAAEGAVTSGYVQELAAANTQAELDAVLKRYGKV